MKKIKVLLIILSFELLFSSVLSAQATYSVKKINNNVYIITQIWSGNNNGNMGVVIGDKNVLIINTLMTKSAPSLLAEIRKITDKPIKYVINNDSDPYNYHANKFFSERGATIVSHENLKYSRAYTEILFTDQISIPIGDETVTAYHTQSHTFDHIDVYLKENNVLFMSDGFKGHWLTPEGPRGVNGFLEGIDKAVLLSDDETIVVPGNTSKNPEYFVNSKSDLIKMRKIHLDFTNQIKKLSKQGQSIEEIANDEVVNKIVENLEAYPKFKKYLPETIEGSLEVNSVRGLSLTKDELLAYTGVYELNDKQFIEIKLENGELTAREKGAFYFALTPLSKSKFDFKGHIGDDYLMFQFSPNGKIESLMPILEKDGWWSNFINEGVRIKK